MCYFDVSEVFLPNGKVKLPEKSSRYSNFVESFFILSLSLFYLNVPTCIKDFGG